jgi:hypothetical protein
MARAKPEARPKHARRTSAPIGRMIRAESVTSQARGHAESFAMLRSWLPQKLLIMNHFELNYNRH